MSDDTLSGSIPLAVPSLSFGIAATPDERIATRTAQLIAAAAGSVSPDDSQLFARLIAAREVRGELALLGLTSLQWHALFVRHFALAATPSLPVAGFAVAPVMPVMPVEHADFVASLRTLLLTHVDAAVNPDDAQALASIIAHACCGRIICGAIWVLADVPMCRGC